MEDWKEPFLYYGFEAVAFVVGVIGTIAFVIATYWDTIITAARAILR